MDRLKKHAQGSIRNGRLVFRGKHKEQRGGQGPKLPAEVDEGGDRLNLSALVRTRKPPWRG